MKYSKHSPIKSLRLRSLLLHKQINYLIFIDELKVDEYKGGINQYKENNDKSTCKIV